jgi:hypothetical protein
MWVYFKFIIISLKLKFAKTRSLLGTGVVSQQFSIPEMVDLALFAAEFLRHAGEHLKILGIFASLINY